MALNWRGGNPSAVHSSARNRLLCVITRWLPPGADSRSVVHKHHKTGGNCQQHTRAARLCQSTHVLDAAGSCA
jgi:hypothetical protein